MDRLACVDVVALPLQLLLGAHPDWRACPVAVVEDDRPQARVLFVNRLARRLGVRTGQRYATALAITHELHAGVVSRSQLERGVRTIADLLRTFSPHVEPSVETPGVFWLDVSGLSRLYRSCTEWATRVHDGLRRAGLQASVVFGFTRFGTYALAISSRGVLCCRHCTDEQTRVERVPLARLPLDPDVRDRLTALGVTSAGDFLRLPADAIRLRFGAETDALFRLASGHSWAPLVPVPAEPIFEATPVHFDRAEDNVERLVFLIKRQLDRLVVEVVAHHQAIVGITLRLRLDNRSRRTESIRPATATLDTTSLLALIRLRLEAIELTSGIVTMDVKADTCPADADQHRLFSETRRSIEAAHQAFARVRAECGEHSVVRARLCDGHLPTSRFAWEPFTQLPERTSPRVIATRPFVRRIHAVPSAVAAATLAPLTLVDEGLPPSPGLRRTTVALREGGYAPRTPGGLKPAGYDRPERAPADARGQDDEFRYGPYVVSGGWWGEAVKGDEPAVGAHREYYFVHTSDGELWWIYVDHRRQRVYLQGQVE